MSPDLAAAIEALRDCIETPDDLGSLQRIHYRAALALIEQALGAPTAERDGDAIVVRASRLLPGKGVIVCRTFDMVLEALDAAGLPARPRE